MNQKHADANKILNSNSKKRQNARRNSKLSLPKIIVNSVDYTKSTNTCDKFVLPRIPLKPVKTSQRYLQDDIFLAQKADDIYSINCSTGDVTLLGDEKSCKELSDKGAFDIFSRCTSQSNPKSRANSMQEIPEFCSFDKNLKKNNDKNFRISNKKPIVRSHGDLEKADKDNNRNKNHTISSRNITKSRRNSNLFLYTDI